MNINLPMDATRFIDALVASGEFESAEQAVVEGVRMLMLRKQLLFDIQEGIDELDAGQGIDGDQVFGELRQRALRRAEN